MKYIKDVTVCFIQGRETPTEFDNSRVAEETLYKHYNSIQFFQYKYLTAQNPDCDHIKISPMDQSGYNRFISERLHEVFDTQFILTVQPDGYIINPELWTDEFLEYDYIGALWPWHGKNMCGNGGFSLRSKKFCQLSSKLTFPGINIVYPEDVFLCRDNRNYFIDHGIKFAPDELASQFSFEHFIPWVERSSIKHSFGFHGKHNI